MKIHLSIGDAPISNYLNLDPVQGDLSLGQEWCACSNFGDLSQFVDPGECWEILADKILDYIHIQDIYNILKYWSSLCRYQGKLIVGGTDLIELSKYTSLGTIDSLHYNTIVFGLNYKKLCIHSMNDIVNYLLKLNLTIIKKRINNLQYIIEAKRI